MKHPEWTKAVNEPAPDAQPRACFCVGPQNGESDCPCRMRARRPAGITLSYDELARLMNRRKMKR